MFISHQLYFFYIIKFLFYRFNDYSYGDDIIVKKWLPSLPKLLGFF